MNEDEVVQCEPAEVEACREANRARRTVAPCTIKGAVRGVHRKSLDRVRWRKDVQVQYCRQRRAPSIL